MGGIRHCTNNIFHRNCFSQKRFLQISFHRNFFLTNLFHTILLSYFFTQRVNSNLTVFTNDRVPYIMLVFKIKIIINDTIHIEEGMDAYIYTEVLALVTVGL